ncbi:hypothetical protein Pmani_036474 [Petrolisthes manimaculis]|uniref:Uncharacterized protein n=1 Tax=Petrolisthes manimaculis TaxID=1843537 RepID=A0AAE1NKX9_9EUCA|nr:hypothetical protein Pmani_036474 [Petrolisthes manimaculis]
MSYRSEIFIDKEMQKTDSLDYGSLNEAGLHPLVSRVLDEEEEFGGSPINSPRFSRRGNRRELKKFRDSSSRRNPLRGPGSWSPEVSVRSISHDSEPFEEGAVVPSAPPMEHMDHFQGYEQVSFEADANPAIVNHYLLNSTTHSLPATSTSTTHLSSPPNTTASPLTHSLTRHSLLPATHLHLHDPPFLTSQHHSFSTHSLTHSTLSPLFFFLPHTSTSIYDPPFLTALWSLLCYPSPLLTTPRFPLYPFPLPTIADLHPITPYKDPINRPFNLSSSFHKRG